MALRGSSLKANSPRPAHIPGPLDPARPVERPGGLLPMGLHCRDENLPTRLQRSLGFFFLEALTGELRHSPQRFSGNQSI